MSGAMAATALVTLVGIVGIAHWLGRFFRPGWRPEWTALLLLAFVLLFVAGLAAVGFAHHVAWLVMS